MRSRFQFGGTVYEVDLATQGKMAKTVVDGMEHQIEVLDRQQGVLSLRFDGTPMTFYWAVDGGSIWITRGGCSFKLERPTGRVRALAQEAGAGEAVRAPMPAQVSAIQVATGDKVEKGQTLMLLEAMKMEIRIKSPEGGLVKRLLVANGQAVDKDQMLVEIGE
jgi:acetyl/propionyl-CoA carboxylase alpha subunit